MENELTPKFSTNATVEYLDRHGRLQSGRITRIEIVITARGSIYKKYYFTHPTYRNGGFIGDEECIKAVIK